MRLFGKRRPEPAPLLSEREMEDLYEEIFLEDVSARRLYGMWAEFPKADRGNSEWVMSTRTWNRIRRLHSLDSAYFAVSRPMVPETLFGRPIVFDDVEPLHLRVISR